MELTLLAGIIIIVLILAGGAAVLPVVSPAISQQDVEISIHALERHAGDEYAPADIKERLDKLGENGFELYLSMQENKLLYLVHLVIELDKVEWLGGRIIGATQHDEITCFAAEASYWQRVIVRDNYYPLNLAAQHRWVRLISTKSSTGNTYRTTYSIQDPRGIFWFLTLKNGQYVESGKSGDK